MARLPQNPDEVLGRLSTGYLCGGDAQQKEIAEAMKRDLDPVMVLAEVTRRAVSGASQALRGAELKQKVVRAVAGAGELQQLYKAEVRQAVVATLRSRPEMQGDDRARYPAVCALLARDAEGHA